MAYLTEKELIERFQFYTLQLEKLLNEEENFLTVADYIPFSAHINDRNTLALLDFNRKGSEYTDHSKEEILAMGTEYFEKHMHPYSWKVETKKIFNFYTQDNPDDVFAFVQYLHLFGNEKEYKPLITFTKICKSDSSRVVCIDLPPQKFGKLAKKMERIVEMDLFRLKNFKRFGQLTSREKEILVLLARGLNNPTIAGRLFISRRTVETHRKNLNRKLGIRRFRDLINYAIAFDLITI